MTLVVDRGRRRATCRRTASWPAKRLKALWDITSVAPHLIGKARDRQGSDRVMELTKRCGPFPSAMFGFAIEGLR